MSADATLFVSAWGTLGDISPLIAVAVEMKSRGTPVHVAGVGDFAPAAAGFGLDLGTEWTTLDVIEGDDLSMADLMNSETGQKWLRREWVSMAEKARTVQLFRERAGVCRRTIESLVEAHEVATVVCDISSFHIVSQVCRATNAVHIVSTPMPYQPSRTFTLSSLRVLSGRSQLANRAYWWWRRARKPRSFREYFDRQVYHLLSASRILFPRPFDWPSNQQVTGYCVPSNDGEAAAWKPPASVTDSLAEGDPPVYVGFGSYPFFTGDRGAEMLSMICDTLRTAGKRAIVCTGFSQVEPTFQESDDVCLIDYAPHDWLLPKCEFALHHGGGGTTYACLAAGIPMIPYPYQTDQFFWSRRIGELGIGPGYRHPVNRMTLANLAENLRLLARQEPFDAAARLGRQVRDERDGAGVQADAIESILDHSRLGGAPPDWRPPWA